MINCILVLCLIVSLSQATSFRSVPCTQCTRDPGKIENARNGFRDSYFEPGARSVKLNTPSSVLRQSEDKGYSLLEFSDNNVSIPETTGAPGQLYYGQIDTELLAFYNKTNGEEVARFTQAVVQSLFIGHGNCSEESLGGMRSPRIFFNQYDFRWLVLFAKETRICWALSPAEAEMSESLGNLSSWVPGSLDVSANSTERSRINSDRLTAGVFSTADAIVLSFQYYRDPFNIPPLAGEVGLVAVRYSNFSQATALFIDDCNCSKAHGNQWSAANIEGHPSLVSYVPLLRIDYFNGDAPEKIQVVEYWEMSIDWANASQTTLESVQVVGVSPENKWPRDNGIPVHSAGELDISSSVPVLGHRVIYRHAMYDGRMIESMVGAYAIVAPGGGGSNGPYCTVQVFELRRATDSQPWELYQQFWIENDGDYNQEYHRFVPSVTTDLELNVAVGYSTAGRALAPDMRYSFHQTEKPPGQVQGEYVAFNGDMKPGGTHRWLTFNSMNSDPSDEKFFYFMSAVFRNPAWQTRLTVFARDGLPQPVDFSSSEDTGDGDSKVLGLAIGVLGGAILIIIGITCVFVIVVVFVGAAVVIGFKTYNRYPAEGKHYQMDDVDGEWESAQPSEPDSDQDEV